MKKVIKKTPGNVTTLTNYNCIYDISVISAKEFTESTLFSTDEKTNKNSFIQSYTLKIKKSMEAQLKIRQGPEKRDVEV